MGAKSQKKGKRGEKELFRILEVKLQLDERIERDLSQGHKGGCDCLKLTGIALEIKRAAKPDIKNWWSQAVSQANDAGRMPVLAYRLDRQQWQFSLPMTIDGFMGWYSENSELSALAEYNPMPGSLYSHRVTMPLDGFVAWYRLNDGNSGAA